MGETDGKPYRTFLLQDISGAGSHIGAGGGLFHPRRGYGDRSFITPAKRVAGHGFCFGSAPFQAPGGFGESSPHGVAGTFAKIPGALREGGFLPSLRKEQSAEIVKILSRPPEGRDLKVLQDLFYVAMPKENQNAWHPRPIRSPGLGPGQMPPGEITADRYFQIIKIKNGFKLTANPSARALPKEATLEVAYDVREGNPFKRYKQFDFQLDKLPIRVKATGVQVKIIKSNMLFLFLEKRDFQLNLTGFDPNRDLKVRMLPSMNAAL